ncbi:TIGR01777 family oxidoreductase [Populibacterium corticicola]|uniref:TIGR01777 family oxidoreductase n=1 Tax=Populibacterium corticicola TaxID=1812826 RepID=A0ABW5XC39_9MICO
MPHTPHVVVSGATGLIGSKVVDALLDAGYDVIRLVRSAKTEPNPRVIDSLWDPSAGVIDSTVIDGAYGVINLAGAGIGDRRWDRIVKREILASRVGATTTLVKAITSVPTPPQVLVSGSATGYYGFPDQIVDETSPSGDTFLAGVCTAWERAASGAMTAGTRVAYARTGLVMSPEGGALKKLLLPLKFGVGGPLGSGEQLWSWISLEDEVRALVFLLEHDKAWGPVNLVAPQTVPHRELVAKVAGEIHRPHALKVPAFALRAVVGEFAQEIVNGVHVEPTVLESLGFEYSHPRVDALARWISQQV